MKINLFPLIEKKILIFKEALNIENSSYSERKGQQLKSMESSGNFLR